VKPALAKKKTKNSRVWSIQTKFLDAEHYGLEKVKERYR